MIYCTVSGCREPQDESIPANKCNGHALCLKHFHAYQAGDRFTLMCFNEKPQSTNGREHGTESSDSNTAGGNRKE